MTNKSYFEMSDDERIDLIVTALFSNLPNSLAINRDIVRYTGTNLSARYIQRMWLIIQSTGWVEYKGGYSDDIEIELSVAGLRLMRKYGSYLSFQEQERKSTMLNSSLINEVPIESPRKKALKENWLFWITIIGTIIGTTAAIIALI